MKQSIVILAVVLLGMSGRASGATIPDFLRVEDIATGEPCLSVLGMDTDLSGNVVLVGNFLGTTSFGDTTLTTVGASDVFVAKYGVYGDLLWVRQAGGDYDNGPFCDRAADVAVDGMGNCYVTGEFLDTTSFDTTVLTSAGQSDAFLAKYDSSGVSSGSYSAPQRRVFLSPGNG